MVAWHTNHLIFRDVIVDDFNLDIFADHQYCVAINKFDSIRNIAPAMERHGATGYGNTKFIGSLRRLDMDPPHFANVAIAATIFVI